MGTRTHIVCHPPMLNAWCGKSFDAVVSVFLMYRMPVCSFAANMHSTLVLCLNIRRVLVNNLHSVS